MGGVMKNISAAITKSLTWKAKGMSVQPQNCSGPEIKAESLGLFFFHTGYYIQLAQETIFIPAGKTCEKIIKAL